MISHSIDHLIDIALAEDIGPGDITTDYLVPPEHAGQGRIIAKEPMVLAGLDVARSVFVRLDKEVSLSSGHADGDRLQGGETVLEVSGKMAAMLMAERTALNFLQRLSGIATHVQAHVQALGGRNTRLVDTRKTTPGWRALEKYAVRVGGAFNHRMGLYDGVLIKDNHIAAHGDIGTAVERIRSSVHHLVKIEVEVSDFDQLEEALVAEVDVIMLDNMEVDQIREAVKFVAKRALVEVSGGVRLENLAVLADCGVDLISVGALTHGARSVDLSMRIL
jgi:nicotinate-nucleotide pyrophosphorylase (carboxylating)